MYRIEFWCSKLYISALSTDLCKYDSATASHLQSLISWPMTAHTGTMHHKFVLPFCTAWNYAKWGSRQSKQSASHCSLPRWGRRWWSSTAIFHRRGAKSCDGELQLSGSSVLPIECSLHFQRAVPSKSEGIAYFPARESVVPVQQQVQTKPCRCVPHQWY